MAHIPGKFMWFEGVTRDVAQAQAFYGELFGWKNEAFPMGETTYEMMKAGDRAIGGWVALEAGDRRAPHWLSYLSVPDVDAAAVAIEAAGGSVGPAFDVPTVGRMASATDPQGAPFMIVRGLEDDPADEPPAHGRWTWNEHSSSDPKAACAFYEKVVGFSHTEMDMGPAGVYRVLEKDGTPRAGLASGAGAPRWLPYVAVDDCDAVAARAARLGGKVVEQPTDIPGVGRFAILTDPQGAVIGVLKHAG